MAVTFDYYNGDDYLRESRGDKIIVNDINYLSIKDNNLLKDSLMTEYNIGEQISLHPSCDCGNLKYNYNIGQVCSDCGTVVMDSYKKLDPILWLRAFKKDPNLTGYHKDDYILLIDPEFWNLTTVEISVCKQGTRTAHVDFLRWICDPHYNPSTNLLPKYYPGVLEILGGKRDYMTVIDKLDIILEYILNLPSTKTSESKMFNIAKLITEYRKNKDKILSIHLPIVNKKIFVLENTSTGRLVDLPLSELIDVVRNWSRDASSSNIKYAKLSSITAATISKLASFYHKYYSTFFTKKEGILRKHIFGTRAHGTFRAVITQLTGPHKFNNIIIPWSVAVTAYRPQILNKLSKRIDPVTGYRYSIKKMNLLLHQAVYKFNIVIDEILTELEAESPFDGIPVLLNRNPTLLQGSLQLVYGKFGRNPNDKTIKISVLIAKGFNADFDGDELNATIIYDTFHAKLLESLSPYFNISDLTKPCSIAGYLSLMSPVNDIMQNFLSDKSTEVDNSLLDSLNTI